MTRLEQIVTALVTELNIQYGTTDWKHILVKADVVDYDHKSKSVTINIHKQKDEHPRNNAEGN